MSQSQSTATPASALGTARPPRGFRALVSLLRYLAAYPGTVCLSVGLLLCIIALDLAVPRLVGAVMDLLSSVGLEASRGALPVHVRLLVSVVLIRMGLAVLLGPIRNRLIQQVLADIRGALYDALQRQAFAFHARTNTGELVSRSTNDVFRVQDFLFACLFLTVDITVTVGVVLVLIFLISSPLGWIALGTLLPTIGLIAFFASRLQPQWRKVHDLHGAMATVIQENIAGVRVVKAFAREQSEVGKFRSRKQDFLGTLRRTVDYWAARMPLSQCVFGLGLPLCLWLGGREVQRGALTLGELTAVLFYLMAIGHRLGLVGQVTNIVQNASASAERILEILEEPLAIRSGRLRLPEGRGHVRFESVSFHYGQGRASLEGVDLEVLPGQTVAIVGRTGSGKSTLVNLVPRFYDATSGRVRVEGVDVRELELRSLRRAVGVMFQESFLFTASVADNIAYGRPQARREDIERCARAAQAHDFILGLEAGYDTVVGERGVTLSGGQKQRIAIARAFLTDPRILILDDALASVDAVTERAIQESLRRLCAGRTTLVIAHRASTVRHADLIVVLEEGRVVQRGTHAQLVGCTGPYQGIFHGQLRGCDGPGEGR